MSARKPDVNQLGIDLAAQTWRRSGSGDGSLEVAFAEALGARWVLLRVAGDPAGRVLSYDEHEWDCFLDGVRKGEFQNAVTEHG